MDIELLGKIGLSKGESRAYVTLIKLGRSSVGGIIKQGKISRSKIYEVLERLKEKGLVSQVTEGKIKKFNAITPNRLHEFLDLQKKKIEEKNEELQKIIPELNAMQKRPTDGSAEILFGPRGIKAFFDMSLYENNEEILVLGYSKEASLYFHAYFRAYHKDRIKRKISGRVIYDYETWFLKNRGKRKYVQQRYLPKGMKTPAFVYIFKDIVGTIVFTKQQKLCFMIKDEEVAKSYRTYFNMLWKHSVKTGK